MCTVSVIGLRGGFRLMCNRDEFNARPAALPPVMRIFGDRHALLPIDPSSNGTWTGVNDAGVAMALLNGNPSTRLTSQPLHGRRSRGVIIPSLLHARDANEAATLASDIDPTEFPPFRLVVIDQDIVAESSSDGHELSATSRSFDGAPLMFTSSSLGDELVEHPRRELFDRLIRTADASPARQDAFHAQRWPSRPELSVFMSRADARTVSQTIIEMTDDAATMRYVAGGADAIARLPIQQLQAL